jgi:GntR family transcriptional regulator/MocR family aminotransferase
MTSSRLSKTPLLSLALDKHADEPAYRQIYDQIRLAILAGQLRPGTRLPSSRGLAAELGVSRNTVLTAFDMRGVAGRTAECAGCQAGNPARAR